MPPKRVIAHLDCDAFYATVELLRRPELVGKPVIVAGSGPRAVVTTASYEARKFGVGSAMPASRARRLCPDAIVIPPDFEAYRETSRRVWEIVDERLDRVQRMGIDEAFADLTGVEKPLRVLREVVAAVKDGDRHRDLDRRRPVAAGGQVLQRPRQARRVRGDGARGGVRALRHRADQPHPGHRPQDRRPPGRARPAHDRRTCRRPTRPSSPRASAPTARAG